MARPRSVQRLFGKRKISTSESPLPTARSMIATARLIGELLDQGLLLGVGRLALAQLLLGFLRFGRGELLHEGFGRRQDVFGLRGHGLLQLMQRTFQARTRSGGYRLGRRSHAIVAQQHGAV
jgi:hypothetical protein